MHGPEHSGHSRLRIIFEDDYLRISARDDLHRAEGGNILLSFTGVGHAMGALNVQQPEFFGAGRSFDNILFITDKTRSWGNRLDFSRIVEILAPFTDNMTLYGIGNSMGGFLTIVASHHLPIRTSISFVPQYSVNPTIVPWETRWKNFTAGCGHRITHAQDYFTDRTDYYIFSAGQGLDFRHAEMFPVAANIFHVLFPDLGHELSAQLKEKGLLSSMVQDCFASRDPVCEGIATVRLSPLLPCAPAQSRA